MGDRFTREQRAAIDAQGRTIVSASAGSGKTTVMIEKIIRLIHSGVDVKEILAVTFTKKAAAQMKEKLGKAIIESINAEDADSNRRAALKKQLAEIPSADISTIHSFCAKLIRTHFFAAGVDNAFRVIGGEDAEGVALKNEALDDLLDEGYETQDEDFTHLLSVYWRKKSDNALRGIFISAYEELRSRADYKAYLQRSAEYDESVFDGVCAELYQRFIAKCRYYEELVEDEKVWFEENAVAAQSALCKELLTWIKEMCSAPDYFALGGIAKPKFTVNRSSKKDSEEKLLHIERIAFLKDKIVKAYEEETGKLLSREQELEKFLRAGRTAKALSKYLLIFDEKYAEQKTERGVLDYNDLEHKALELLSREEIAEEVREKYRYVFVDEYQDVNPVQEAIVSMVGGENLFLVGDVKQSIYGFRGSKSKFFVEKQRAFENGEGKSLIMTRNFRSADKVLDAVNTQFSLAMTPRTCDVDYARGSVMERGGRYEVNSGRVQIHYLGKAEKKEEKPRGVYSVKAHTGKQEEDMSQAAKVIRHIIEEERRKTWFDPDLGRERAIGYSDIAVLSRKKQGQIAQTVAALSAEGVPVTSASAVNICDYAEIKTLMDILSLIDNAEQDIPLCSALLSAMGNLTADELADIRLAYGAEEEYFRRACERYAEEKQDALAEKLRAFYAYYQKLRTDSRVTEAGELLSQILVETRMEARLLARENGVACLKRIHRFIEEASAVEPLCVHEFLNRLRDLDYKIEYSENGGGESVKVLTMHSSKGLEYPVVILDNLSAHFRGADHDEVVLEEEYGLAPRAFDTEKMSKSTTLLRRLYEVKSTESSIADELNLYYVALTRAKYALHMVFEQRLPMPNVKYARSFAELTDFSVWREYETQDDIFDVPKQERTALVFRPDENLVQDIIRSLTWEYAHTGYENLRVKSSATQLLDGGFETGEGAGFGKKDERLEDSFDEGESAPVKETGIAYHAFLEKFDFSMLYGEGNAPVSRAELEEVVLRELGKFTEKEPAVFGLLSAEKLVEILSNPVFYELGGMRLYKERQFLVSLPIKETYAKKHTEFLNKEDGEEMIFQGAIDLLGVGEEIRIIDYKYSMKDGESLRAHYQPQLDLYRLATAKILGVEKEKIRCTIVNIRRGFQVEMD